MSAASATRRMAACSINIASDRSAGSKTFHRALETPPFGRSLDISNRPSEPFRRTSTLFTAGAGGAMCVGIFALASPSSTRRCSTEALSSGSGGEISWRRRRPPVFGSSTPPPMVTTSTRSHATADGYATMPMTDIGDVAVRDDCPLCKKFGSGPCGESFWRWLACTDEHPGKDVDGELLHLTKCSDIAKCLAECLESNTEYYANYNDDTEIDGKLKDAWVKFVNEMEGCIESGKYEVKSFPEEISPRVEVRPDARTGAAFFSPERDGQPLVAAFILDDRGDVMAAGSKEDMDMGPGLGCVLRFKVPNGMKSVTVRTIYDTKINDVEIFAQIMLLPRTT